MKYLFFILTLIFLGASCFITADEFKERWRKNAAEVLPTEENLNVYASLVNATLMQKPVFLSVVLNVPPSVVVPIIKGLLVQHYSVEYGRNNGNIHSLRIMPSYKPFDCIPLLSMWNYEKESIIESCDAETQAAFLSSYENHFENASSLKMPHFINTDDLLIYFGLTYSETNHVFGVTKYIHDIDVMLQAAIGSEIEKHVPSDIAIYVAMPFVRRGFQVHYTLTSQKMKVEVNEKYPNDGAFYVVPFINYVNITALEPNEMIKQYFMYLF